MTNHSFKLVILISFFISSCSLLAQDVTIGTQIWTNTNLEVKTFRNGDIIPEAKTTEEWLKATQEKQPAWCYYRKKKKYGILYNWYALNDPRQLAPLGYHIPSDEEWSTLVGYLGGDNIAGDKLKSKEGWYYSISAGDESVGINGNGKDLIGFTALPRGLRSQFGYFGRYNEDGYWWSSTENDEDYAWVRSINTQADEMRRVIAMKGDGYSVRCVKD